jgi:hypothetical protein
VYCGLDRDIVFVPTGTKHPGSDRRRVALEVDNAVSAWSVLMSGHARDQAPGQVGGDRGLVDWPAGERDSLNCIAVDRISGRRLPG